MDSAYLTYKYRNLLEFMIKMIALTRCLTMRFGSSLLLFQSISGRLSSLHASLEQHHLMSLVNPCEERSLRKSTILNISQPITFDLQQITSIEYDKYFIVILISMAKVEALIGSNLLSAQLLSKNEFILRISENDELKTCVFEGIINY